MDDILAAFPQLDDTAAAAIAYAFNQWWLNQADGLLAYDDDHKGAIIGFAAGWLARPADYTG